VQRVSALSDTQARHGLMVATTLRP